MPMTAMKKRSERRRGRSPSSSSYASENDDSTGSYSKVKYKQINIKWITVKC